MLSNKNVYTEKIKALLNEYRVIEEEDKKKCNYQCYGSFNGCFNIPKDKIETLLKLWTKSIKNNEETITILEKQKEYGPLIVDFDFNQDKKYRIYDDNLIYEVYYNYIQAINKYVICKDKNLNCFIFEKEKPSIKKDGIYKDGFHLYFPLVLTFDVKEKIRTYVNENINKDMFSEFLNNIDDINDKAMIKSNGLILYGGKKPGGQVYINTKIIEKSGADTDYYNKIKYRDNDFYICDYNQLKEDVKPNIKTLVKVFSLNNSYYKEKNLLKLKQIEENIKNNETKLEINDNDIILDIEDIRDIVLLIEDKYDYHNWSSVGFGLYNLSKQYDINELKQIFNEWSSKDKSYSEIGVNKFWNSLKKIKDSGIKLGTLIKFAQESNPEEVKKILSKYNKFDNSFKNILLNGNELEKAEYISSKFIGDNLKVCIYEDSNKIFYYDINNKLWNELTIMELSIIIKHIIVNNINDKILKQKYSKSSSLRDIIESLLTKYKDNEFLNKLNCSSVFELPLINGQILDLRTGDLRERTNKDYYSFELDLKLDDSDNSFEYNFLKKLMNNDDIKTKYLIDILSYCLCGSQGAKSFFVFYGSGSNGKSILIDIMTKLLNKFVGPGNKKIILKYKNESETKPEFKVLRDKRMVYINEVEQNEEFNNTILKNISGGDELAPFRMLRENTQQTFKSPSKLILCCNLRPKFDTSDQAMLQRIKYIKFKSKFILDSNITPDPQLYEYRAELDIKDKININKLFYILVKNFKDLYNRNLNLTMPKCCLDDFEDYLAEASSIKSFIKNCLYYDEKSKLNFKDIYNNYNIYCHQNKLTVIGKNIFYDDLRTIIKTYKGDKKNGYYLLNYSFVKENDESDNENDLDI